MPGARNLALEAAIVADWHDEQAWEVYADWLQAQGDPLGEFLSLRQAWRANADADTDALVHALDSVGRESVLGENFAALLDARPEWLKIVRRDAFVDEARLGPSSDPRLLEALDALLDSTAARFMRGLRVELRDAPEQQHTRALARLLAAGIQPALHRLELVLEMSTPPSPSAFEATLRQLAGLLPLLPNLEALCLDGYAVELREGLEHARLTRLELRNCGLGPLLDFAHQGHAGMPKLRELALDMMQLAHAGCLAEVVDSPLFGRLEVVRGGSIDDRTAQIILDHRHRFAHVHEFSLHLVPPSSLAGALREAFPEQLDLEWDMFEAIADDDDWGNISW